MSQGNVKKAKHLAASDFSFEDEETEQIQEEPKSEVEPAIKAEVEPEPEAESETEEPIEETETAEPADESEAVEAESEDEAEPEAEAVTDGAEAPEVEATPEPEPESKTEAAKDTLKKIAAKVKVPGKATGKRPSLFKRLFLALMLISAGFSVILTFAVSAIYQTSAVDEMANMLEGECTLVKSVLHGDSQDVMRLANLQLGEIQLTYISTDGTPLYDNHTNVENLPNLLDQVEVADAINSGAGSSETFDKEDDTTVIYRALRLDNGCVVRLGAEKTGTAAAVARQNVFVVLVAIAAVFASWIIARLVAARLMDPIFDIEPENPEESTVYAELEPLVNQITIQDELLGSPEKVDLHALVANVARRVRPVAKGKGVKFTCSGAAAEIIGMPNMLDTLVFNLCDNAVRYTGEGGKVRIWTGIEDKMATLRIEDSGVGIPEEELSHIFERFYRTEKGAELNEAGNGMGLSYVKQAAEVHGAEISLESEPDMGTTVTVRFPLEVVPSE